MASSISQARQIPARPAPPVQALNTPIEEGTKFAFQCFLWFGVIVFLAPQAISPAVSALGIGKIIMFLALFSYAKFAYSQGRLSFVKGSELKIMAWFLLLSLISVSFSRWRGGSLQFFIDNAWKAGVVFLLAANLLTSGDRARRLSWTFVLFAAVNSFIGLKNWASGNMLSGGASNRIEGGFAPLASNPNDLGLLLNMCIPLVWYAYRTAKTRATRYIALLTTIAAAVTVVITFSRGAFLGLLVVAGLFAWKLGKGKRVQVFVLIAVLLPLLLAVLPAGYSDRIVSIFYSDMDDGSREHRLKLMEVGVTSMIQHPLGVGLGMNILTSVDAGLGWNVIHNAYLQVGVELGVLGFILYLLLIWKTYQGLTAIEQSPVRNIADLAFAIRLSLIAFAVGGFFGPVAFNLYFFYPGGMAVALKSLVKESPDLLRVTEAESI